MNCSRICAVFLAAGAFSAVAEATEVRLEGSSSFQVSGSHVTIQAERVRNYERGGRSGTLRLTLWATTTRYAGGSISGYRIGETNLGTLDGGFSFNNISQTTSYTAPPDGTYWITLALSEFQGSDFFIKDYIAYSELQTIGEGNRGWSTPPGSVINVGWTPAAGDRLTFEIREAQGAVMPPGTVVSYIFETPGRFYATGGSSSAAFPQADASTRPVPAPLDGVSRPAVQLDYDYSVYEGDPLARGDMRLFFYTRNSGVYTGYDQDSSAPGGGTTRGTFTLERASRGLWGDTADLGGGWRYSPWFGYFSPLNDWLYHQQHGWLYAIGDDAGSVYFFDWQLSLWYWTSESVYPFIYAFAPLNTWLMFDPGSTRGNRWFHRSDLNQWFPETSVLDP